MGDAALPEIRAGNFVLEVRPSQYYKRLRRNDRKPLQHLVTLLGERLEERGHSSVIVAVGSSTFPDSYWTNRVHHPFYAAGTYEDIDLRVLPLLRTPPSMVKNSTAELLIARGVPWDDPGFPQMKSTETRVDEKTNKVVELRLRATAYIIFPYDEQCLTTRLSSGTPVEFLFGDEVHRFETAYDFLERERRENKAFCLLY